MPEEKSECAHMHQIFGIVKLGLSLFVIRLLNQSNDALIYLNSPSKKIFALSD